MTMPTHIATSSTYNPSYLGKYWCQVINTTASPTASVLLIVYPVAAVLSAVIVIVSLISVTVILLLVKRQRRERSIKDVG